MGFAADSGGWTNLLGSGVVVNVGAAMGLGVLRRWVTAADQSGSNRTYDPVAIVGSETGYQHAFAIRGANLTTPIDDIATGQGATLVTPHVLPGLPGANLGNGSLVLGCVAKDGTGAYSAVPSGYSLVINSDTNQGRWSGVYNSKTVAGVDVPATNITPSAADEYAAVTIAIAPA